MSPSLKCSTQKRPKKFFRTSIPTFISLAFWTSLLTATARKSIIMAKAYDNSGPCNKLFRNPIICGSLLVENNFLNNPVLLQNSSESHLPYAYWSTYHPILRGNAVYSFSTYWMADQNWMSKNAAIFRSGVCLWSFNEEKQRLGKNEWIHIHIGVKKKMVKNA